MRHYDEEQAAREVGGAAFGILKLLFLGFKGIFLGIGALGAHAEQNRKKGVLFIPDERRFEHTHIVGGSGWGKTQLLQSTICSDDLRDVSEGKKSVIVIDSQGDMIEKLMHLNAISPSWVPQKNEWPTVNMAHRVIIIDPTDIENPPCLNLFDFGLNRLKDYDPVEREKLVNGAIALYEYIFSQLLGAEMTNRQGVIFRYIARLLMVVPTPTIYTLMDFMEEPELVKQYLPLLDLPTQRFIVTQFLSSNFDTTRQQILARLWGVLSNNVLARMFSHTENKLDLFEAINSGSLILINTAKDLLKQEGCELFGRFMIALITQAVQERAAIPEQNRLPTFVYIDEAQDYFEEGAGIELLLTQARKYKVGVILAHQNLAQLGRKLTATIMSSTSVKYAGGVSVEDAEKLAKELHTETEYILSLDKDAQKSNFAVFVRNQMTEGQRVYCHLGYVEGWNKMSETDYQKLRDENRKRYCAPYDPNMLLGVGMKAGMQFDLEIPKVL